LGKAHAVPFLFPPVLPLALERSACSCLISNIDLQGAKAFRRCGYLW
jgi:hypothetical protein